MSRTAKQSRAERRAQEVEVPKKLHKCLGKKKGNMWLHTALAVTSRLLLESIIAPRTLQTAMRLTASVVKGAE